MRTNDYTRSKNFQKYLKSKISYDENGEFHCDNGPAIIEPGGDKFWFKHGKLHREDGPASEFEDGDKEWFLNDTQISKEEFERFVKLKGFW